MLAAVGACTIAIGVGLLNLHALTTGSHPANGATSRATDAAHAAMSPTARSSPSPPALPLFSSEVPSLDGVTVFDYTGGSVDPSVERQWAQAALMFDRLRIESLRLASPVAAAGLFAPGSSSASTDGLVPLVQRLAAEHRAVTVTGSPRWLSVGVERLTEAQRVEFVRLGAQVGEYAMLLSESGPVVVSNGALAVTVVPADVSLNLLIPGALVHDARFGELWQATYVVDCRVGSPEVSLLCTGR